MVVTDKYKAVLEDHIPDRALPRVTAWLREEKVRLRLAPSRISKYGDYYWCNKKGHCISINEDLNPYSFLLTLVHELAHLRVWKKHKNRVKPHGKQWKEQFRKMMLPFLTNEIFPEKMLTRVALYLKNPKASTCTDQRLIRVLRQYDDERETVLLEDLMESSWFLTQNGRLFRKGEQLRKRFRCREVPSQQVYLFNPVVEVYKI